MAAAPSISDLEARCNEADQLISTLASRVASLEAGNSDPPPPRDQEMRRVIDQGSAALTVQEKVKLITRGLQEVIGEKDMEAIISKRDMKLYWGTATTGAPHIAYFVPMTKIADFLRAGCEVTILFADLHAYLDNMKSSWEVLQFRVQYYEAIIKAMLRSLGVSLDKLRFVQGTDYQLSKQYTLDIYKLTSLVTEHNAKRAGAEVVKQVASPLLSGMLYPLLQALDEEYLGVDAQFGGVDQRKIFILAQDCLTKIGYKKRIHLMNPMVPGLTGDKMSASVKNSKIDMLDPPNAVKKKINGAFCEEGNVENNGVLSFVEMVLFPSFDVSGRTFKIERKAEFGGDVEYKSFEELKADFAAKNVHPGDLKRATTREINLLMDPIREEFKTPEMQELVRKAYPAAMKGGKQSAGGSSKKTKSKDKAAGPRPAPAEAPTANRSAKSPGGSGDPDASALDVRVGLVETVQVHPKNPKCYVLQVNVGENRPRTVVGGFAEALPTDKVKGQLVVVQVNLKSSNFKGVTSEAMVLAAEKDGKVELISPPAGCAVGDRVTFPGYPAPEPVPIMNPKKKIFQKFLGPHMQTNGERVACFKDSPFTTAKGVCTVATLAGAQIK